MAILGRGEYLFALLPLISDFKKKVLVLQGLFFLSAA